MSEKVMIELIKTGPAYIKAIGFAGFMIITAAKISKCGHVTCNLPGGYYLEIDEEDNKQ